MREEPATAYRSLNGRRYFTAKAAAHHDAIELVRAKYPDDFREEYDRLRPLMDRVQRQIISAYKRARQIPPQHQTEGRQKGEEG